MVVGVLTLGATSGVLSGTSASSGSYSTSDCGDSDEAALHRTGAAHAMAQIDVSLCTFWRPGGRVAYAGDRRCPPDRPEGGGDGDHRHGLALHLLLLVVHTHELAAPASLHGHGADGLGCSSEPPGQDYGTRKSGSPLPASHRRTRGRPYPPMSMTAPPPTPTMECAPIRLAMATAESTDCRTENKNA